MAVKIVTDSLSDITSDLASELGVTKTAVVGNKIRNETDKAYIISRLPGLEILGFLPYDQAVVDADIAGKPVLEASPSVAAEVNKIFAFLLSSENNAVVDKST